MPLSFIQKAKGLPTRRRAGAVHGSATKRWSAPDGSASWRAAVFERLAVATWLWLAAGLNLMLAGAQGQPASGGAEAVPPFLTSVEQIRRLGAEDWGKRLPVRLQAVVTYYNSKWPVLFIQDKTGGMYVESSKDMALATGNEVQLTGVAGARGYIVSPAVTVLAKSAPWPIPVAATLNALENGALDSQYVTFEGVLFSVTRDLGHHTLAFLGPGNRRFRGLIPEETVAPEPLEGWIDSRLRLTAVVGADVDERGAVTGWMLWIPGPDHVEIVEAAPKDAFNARPVTIAAVRQQDASPQPARRVLVAGYVTSQPEPGGFYLQDQTGSLYVQTKDPAVFRVGAPVEVVGFPAESMRLMNLMRAVARARAAPFDYTVAPVALAASNLLDLKHGAALVKTTGHLLKTVIVTNHVHFVMQGGETIFTATGQGKEFLDAARGLQPGYLLEMTGICSLKMDQDRKPDTLELLMREPADLRVMEKLPWFTTTKALTMVATLLLLTAAILAWAMALRYQVGRQTRRLGVQLGHEIALEQRYRNLFENASDLLYTHDLAGHFTSINKAAELATGYSQAEMGHLNIAQVVAPEYLGQAMEAMRRQLAGEDLPPFRIDIHSKDGRRIHLELSTRLIRSDGNPVGVQGIARDITERKRAEEALERSERTLRESERMLRIIIDNIPQAVIWKDCHSVILGCNRQQARISGAEDPQQLVGKTDYDLTSTRQEADSYVAADREVMETNTARYHLLETIHDAQGNLHWLDTTKVPLCDAAGKVTGILVTYEDISDRKRAEEIVRGSEEKYRVIFDSATDALILHDAATFDILDVNRLFTELFTYTAEEARELGFECVCALLPPFTLEAATDYFSRAAREGPQFFEWLARDKKHRHFWIEASLKRIDISGQPRIISAIRDITERKQLEEQLRQAQKMEAIGQLAGGVAHDFNNLLTIIKGHVALLIDDVQRQPGVVEALQEVNSAADRAANLTRQLLAFSRRQVLQTKTVDLNEVLDNVSRMLKRLLGEHIELTLEYGADLPVLEADAGMLEQVVMNLAVNARDAMPNGGRLRLRTEVMEVDDLQTQRHADARPGRFVCLTVTDEGCGMDETTLSHLFEPFFTTKEVGKGTGLGLATLYGIIKQHRGWVEVYSVPGEGTTFKVFLPALAEAKLETPRPAAAPVLKGGPETILVVEDEALVRQLAVRCLQQFGYEVQEAATGVEALGVWQQHRGRIQLLLTDMVMPEGISGRDLAIRCLADKPGLQVIYSSGYSVEAVSGELKLVEGVNFLPKPYEPARLLQIVRACLDKAAAGDAPR